MLTDQWKVNHYSWNLKQHFWLKRPSKNKNVTDWDNSLGNGPPDSACKYRDSFDLCSYRTIEGQERIILLMWNFKDWKGWAFAFPWSMQNHLARIETKPAVSIGRIWRMGNRTIGKHCDHKELQSINWAIIQDLILSFTKPVEIWWDMAGCAWQCLGWDLNKAWALLRSECHDRSGGTQLQSAGVAVCIQLCIQLELCSFDYFFTCKFAQLNKIGFTWICNHKFQRPKMFLTVKSQQ